jgi:hypothetical protein
MKTGIGILLIFMAIGFLAFWEVKGRDALLMEYVIVAREDILPGTEINRDMFMEVGFPRENIMAQNMKIHQVGELDGSLANQVILKNSQISPLYFKEKAAVMEEGKGIFQIKEQWIFSISSSIRKGDQADIYSMPGGERLGSFQVAFAKDSQGKEVVEEDENGKTIREEEILDRESGSAGIAQIEIVATLEEYARILDQVFNNQSQLIVMNRRG